jgi:hypothetical protein
MSKRKQSGKRPQAKHRQNKTKSQFDKRSRLAHPNPARQKTTRASIPLVGTLASFVATLGSSLGLQTACRLAIIAAGMMLTDGQCVAAAWFSNAGVRDDWDRFYDCLICVGNRSSWISCSVLRLVLKVVQPMLLGRLLLVLDDSPTQRYGKHVEGAGVHHDPTPGPAGSQWLYGHNWVSLCVLATHPQGGVIALPILSLLYVRAIDVEPLVEKYGWEFRTKHELAVELVLRVVQLVGGLKRTFDIWVVADGA